MATGSTLRARLRGLGARAPHDRVGLALLLLGAALGVAAAWLVVADWKLALVALGLGLVLPALIVLHRDPLLAVLAWLALNQFLLTTEPVLPYRVAFWMFHRALPPVAVAIVAVSAMVGISRRPLPRLGLPELAMAAYLAGSLVSVLLLGPTPLASAYHLYDRVFVPMCLYLIVRLAAPDERDLLRLAAVAGFICLAQAVVGLLAWTLPGLLPEGWLGQAGARTIGSLLNTSTYTSTLIFCALLLLQVALNRGRGTALAICLALFAVALAFTFLSFSRASWLGALLVLIGLCALYPLFMVRLGLLATPALAVVLSLGLLTHQLSWASERLSSPEATGSALDRLPAYAAALRMAEARPLFGWGYENFERFDRQFQERVLDLRNDNKDHASHSAYLTILAEQGAVGLLLYLAAPLWWLAASARAARRLPASGLIDRRLLALLWLVLLNIFVQNNFTPAWVTYGLGLWWLTIGLIASVAQRAGSEPR